VNESTGSSSSSAGHEILSRSQDYIGYLHDLGLNYGWGFTSSMQWVIEHLHVWGGLPWAMSIMGAAVALRVAMFYPMVKSTAFAARSKRMQEDPRHQQVKEAMKSGVAFSDPVKRQQLQAVNVILKKEYNAPVRGMLWGFLPIPFSFGLFRAVSGMCNLPVPGWENAGYLWFQDLTATDPYFVLPVATAGMMALTMHVR
jgi:YidC/Oxa1 family membrane protein insertase